MPNKKVLMSHDGGVDDYLSVMLLMSMQNVDVLGIVVTPADCYIEPAVSATRKILDLMGKSHVPVARSTVRGINPFPYEYRKDSFSIDNFPILNQKEHIDAPLVETKGQDYIVETLRAQPEPVVFLETGPLTTLAEAFKKAPDIAAKISEIVWMGGALNVPGNINPRLNASMDGSMEFNVFWDPEGAYDVWQTDIPVVMCPLDITNTVPLTAEFMRQLGRQYRYPLSDLAGQCYALVRHQPYYFWDVLTTAFVGHPEIFELKDWDVEIIPDGPSQGRTKIVSGGKPVKAMHAVDHDQFYAYVYDQWAR